MGRSEPSAEPGPFPACSDRRPAGTTRSGRSSWWLPVVAVSGLVGVLGGTAWADLTSLSPPADVISPPILVTARATDGALGPATARASAPVPPVPAASVESWPDPPAPGSTTSPGTAGSAFTAAAPQGQDQGQGQANPDVEAGLTGGYPAPETVSPSWVLPLPLQSSSLQPSSLQPSSLQPPPLQEQRTAGTPDHRED